MGTGDNAVINTNPFAADGKITPEVFRATVDAAKRNKVAIEESDQYGGGLAGTAVAWKQLDNGRQFPIYWRIRVNRKHPPPVKFATLAHELGHIFCGHLGAHPQNLWPSRAKLAYEQMELEAEAVCWLVCQRHGITPNSPAYLRELVGKVDLASVSMWAIYAAAKRVESGRKRASAAEPEIGP